MKVLKISFVVATLCLVGALAACNTVDGAGKDLQKGSHAVSKSIDNATADKPVAK
jgi:predicted small secreted protein